MTDPNVRVVAVAQAAPIAGDTRATLRKLDLLAGEAATRGAGLVLFPEAFVGGYPRGLAFGCTIGNRSAQGREEFRRYWDAAIDVPGPVCLAIGESAARHRIHLACGVIERDAGTLYCTVLFHGPDGALIGKHRKLMPTGAERLIWGFGDGSTMPVLDTPLGRVGAVICWENYMPLLRAAYYAKGIQIYLAPTADGRESWLSTMRHIAMEGRCFVLSCNQFARRADYPADYAEALGKDPARIVSRGGSCIVGPLGDVLAGPDHQGEAILTASIDLREITRAKLDFDPVGHYARPDVFRLHVNERPMPPVVFEKE